jgi:hypothetical protein
MKQDEEFNLYNEENREELTEADEIDPAEQGFMQGYDDESNPSQCANCGRVLERDFIEQELKEEKYRFCCEDCALKFEKKVEHA